MLPNNISMNFVLTAVSCILANVNPKFAFQWHNCI